MVWQASQADLNKGKNTLQCTCQFEIKKFRWVNGLHKSKLIFVYAYRYWNLVVRLIFMLRLKRMYIRAAWHTNFSRNKSAVVRDRFHQQFT